MKRMLANKGGQNVQGNQCCFQALEVLVQLKNSKHKAIKPDICQTDSPGARIPVVAVFQVQWSRKHFLIPLHGGNWPHCLHYRCRRGCEHSLSAAPHLSLLLECSGLGEVLQFSAHVRISHAPTKPAASSGFSAEGLKCSSLQTVLCI